MLEVVGEAVFASDVISVNGLDDRLNRQGVIEQAQQLMAARAPLNPEGRDDMAAHLLLRVVMEDNARTPFAEEREADRIKVLADLDGLPVDARTSAVSPIQPAT